MRRAALLLLSCIALAACDRGQPVRPATQMAASSATATTTVDGLRLQTSTVSVADLNAATAKRYGIDTAQGGMLLLVTVRDAAGNAADPGDLQLTGTATVLPDAPKPLQLRAVTTDGMTDYLGVVQATAPASLQFKLTAVRGGSRADIATTAELQPR